MELLSVDWIPGKICWLHEEIKENAVFGRDPIDCVSALKQGILFWHDFLPPHCLEGMLLIHLNGDRSGKPKFELKMVPPLLADQRFGWG